MTTRWVSAKEFLQGMSLVMPAPRSGMPSPISPAGLRKATSACGSSPGDGKDTAPKPVEDPVDQARQRPEPR